jgi:catechol 2,3-dioxygenase-like lactoylglutathione lyase family enzyme
MDAAEFARSLTGFGVNLLVRDVERAVAFQSMVLGSRVIYADPDFAVVEIAGERILFHADHTYLDHPMRGVIAGVAGRGAGVELRLYGIDPDACESRARDHDFTILDASGDKPHGLRECFLLDHDSYVWVPSRPLTRGERES